MIKDLCKLEQAAKQAIILDAYFDSPDCLQPER
jgi:hypothetical protein